MQELQIKMCFCFHFSLLFFFFFFWVQGLGNVRIGGSYWLERETVNGVWH